MAELKNLSIKQWAAEDRPREKLVLKGSGTLTDAELLAILISSGNQEETAVDVAKRILNTVNNNLHELGKLSLKDLQLNKGIGEAKAITIIAALELGRRRKLSDSVNKPQIQSAEDIFNEMLPILTDLPHEEFWVIFLNRSNKIIEKTKISQGGIAGTVIDIKIILKFALDKLASSIIICHNHPSGNKSPSNTDIEITRKLKNAAELIDIKLLDHIIIADKNYFSFADEEVL